MSTALAPFLPSAREVGRALLDSTPLPLLGGSRPAAKQRCRTPAGKNVPPTGVEGAEQSWSVGGEPSGRGVALLPAVTLHLSQVPSESTSQSASE